MSSIPELKLVKTIVARCASCKKWICRAPQWTGDDLFDKGWQCKCGCTSVKFYEGRPYGPRSKEWPELVQEFQELYPLSQDVSDAMWSEWFLSTVEVAEVTDCGCESVPNMRTLKEAYDWELSKKYAWCISCKEGFIDDLPLYGSVHCPNNCGNRLFRGLTEIELKNWQEAAS